MTKPTYVCYCDKVTEQDIEAAVLQGARTVKQVIQMTGAMSHCNCAVENPKGT